MNIILIIIERFSKWRSCFHVIIINNEIKNLKNKIWKQKKVINNVHFI